MLELIRALARNNQWSNVRVFGALERLSAREFSATRMSFFGSIQATLAHIVLVDCHRRQ